MEAVKIIGTGVAMLIGLILLPVITNAVDVAILRSKVPGGTGSNVTPVQNITGLSNVIELVPYIYVFVLIGAGLLAMYHFYKT